MMEIYHYRSLISYIKKNYFTEEVNISVGLSNFSTRISDTFKIPINKEQTKKEQDKKIFVEIVKCINNTYKSVYKQTGRVLAMVVFNDDLENMITIVL